jgi:hypothetical protein
MGIRLDHIIVPSHNRLAAAKSLAGLLDVPWRESAPGPGGFAPVYVSETLTLDFAGADDLNTRLGGKNVYWGDADGHQWEILTASYARADSPSPA